MTDMPANTRLIGTYALRDGLYVYMLDRPWVETPFPFQGFRIETDEEINTLREYCDHVYVDVNASDPEAVALAIKDTLRGDPAGGDGRTIQIDSPLFDTNPIVDRDAFGSRIEQAASSRLRLREAVTGAFRRVVSERSVDVNKTRVAVSSMADLIKDDPTATLWLTRLNAKDDYTSRHAINACVMTLVFGRNIGLKGRELESAALGTLLMDVGRMMIPGNVLPKPGKLSETEWSYVQRHVRYGVQLLSRSKLPEDSLDIVRMHHERAYGQGYPEGLMADHIAGPALVAGLVDSYDAMLHKRPYREAFRPDEAAQLLYNDAESTFGVELVEKFIWYLGTYPVGSVVELDNGSIGVVVGSRPGKGVAPTVLLVRDPTGQPLKRRALVNLDAANRRPWSSDVPARSVKRTLNAREANVPVGKIVAREFGLDKFIMEATEGKA